MNQPNIMARNIKTPGTCLSSVKKHEVVVQWKWKFSQWWRFQGQPLLREGEMTWKQTQVSVGRAQCSGLSWWHSPTCPRASFMSGTQQQASSKKKSKQHLVSGPLFSVGGHNWGTGSISHSVWPLLPILLSAMQQLQRYGNYPMPQMQTMAPR